MFSEDRDKLAAALEEASGANIVARKNGFKGTYMSEGEGNLLLAVPYDKGYTFKVNGKKVKAERVLTDFISIPVTAGENKISAKYVPQGFGIGLMAALFGLALSVLFVIFRNKLETIFQNYFGIAFKVSNILCILLGIAVAVAVYIFPILLSVF